MVDFNRTPSNPNLVDLVSHYELQNLLYRAACFKSANPSCIDNFLTTRNSRFMKTLALETDVCNHYKLIRTMLRSTFAKGWYLFFLVPFFSLLQKCRNNKQFEEKLKQELLFVTNFYSFHTTSKSTLNKFDPLKKKKIRYNQPFNHP